ncbi:DUF4435 domain-containing protein [Vibrio coralliirubri]|uniref:DUF4435 domain-containing protein n=1 Tax=Vibrio coralliirubri TaxID=1516159 RepID=UPI00073F4B91|nr:DUF4435 domain-containing protein [Vibrio coralliirubri]
MSRVNTLNKAKDALSVKFLEFTRAVSRENGRFAVFFEGEDEKYFSVRLNNINPSLSWVGIKCGGKGNVKKMREKIRSHSVYSDSCCMFFVDADFDDNGDLSNFSDTYVTPSYSVENFYISSTVLRRILNAEFGISEICNEYQCFENVVNHYESHLEQYLENISEFNYLIKTLRDLEKQKILQSQLNLNQLKLEDLLNISLTSVNKVYDHEVPHSIFPSLPEGLDINTGSAKVALDGQCKSLWFRGKQNLEFFRIYLTNLKTDRCKKSDRVLFKDRGNVKLQLSKANILSELSQYAETPECLSAFINNQPVINKAA